MNNLVKYNPANELDTFNDGWFSNHEDWLSPFSHGFISRFFNDFPKTYESQINDKGELSLNFNVAGFKKSDVKVNLSNNLLVIEASNKQKTFKTSMTVDTYSFDSENVKAKLEDGILNIIIPPNPKNTPKQIVVE